MDIVFLGTSFLIIILGIVMQFMSMANDKWFRVSLWTIMAGGVVFLLANAIHYIDLVMS